MRQQAKPPRGPSSWLKVEGRLCECVVASSPMCTIRSGRRLCRVDASRGPIFSSLGRPQRANVRTSHHRPCRTQHADVHTFHHRPCVGSSREGARWTRRPASPRSRAATPWYAALFHTRPSTVLQFMCSPSRCPFVFTVPPRPPPCSARFAAVAPARACVYDTPNFPFAHGALHCTVLPCVVGNHDYPHTKGARGATRWGRTQVLRSQLTSPHSRR